MRLLRHLALYLALGLSANMALADYAAVEALRTGDMKKLVFHDTPKAVTDTAFVLADGAGDGRLSDYRGKYVVLNFWATWCAPCRKEMPHLDALQQDFGGDRFEVVTLATGRNSLVKIKAFFAENNITALPRDQDAKQAVAREMSVLGLPITVIIDPEGREIARLRGDADWYSDSAKAIIQALLDSPSG
jgi:thiol-disulfide isomerase/thioredoxin